MYEKVADSQDMVSTLSCLSLDWWKWVINLYKSEKVSIALMFTTNAAIKFSRKSPSHKSLVRQFLQNWVGRSYLMAVTGSMWLLHCLRGCYGVYIQLFFHQNCLACLLQDRFTWCNRGITVTLLTLKPHYSTRLAVNWKIRVNKFLVVIHSFDPSTHLSRSRATTNGPQGCHIVISSKRSTYTLLKSDVTTRDHVVRRRTQECGSRNVNFACKFHRRSHRFA